jgi:hypothetical protein
MSWRPIVKLDEENMTASISMGEHASDVQGGGIAVSSVATGTVH